jgi:FtsP/CotA-like multicopper oxidase with cupredoxin domain
MAGGMIAAVCSTLLMAFNECAAAPESSIYVQCGGGPGPGVDCIHLAAGDGQVTMADDAAKPLYIFSFSEVPLPGVDGAPTDPSLYAGFVMDYGLLSANAPAPTIAVDEDDDVYLNLTNVGMVLRPDLSDPHTVHWHGFPNASSVFDGVPESSVAINMGATLSYYYKPVDAGTYMYHCHVEATEHMQMGMLGNLYVRPRQNKLTSSDSLFSAFASNPANTANGGSTAPPAVDTSAMGGDTYAYNDGDGTTRYDVEVPIQIGSFDPDFHDASYLVQPLPFRSMKDKYFLLNGRGYPDTVKADNPATTGIDESVISTLNDLGNLEDSQPVSSLIEATAGDIILLRISNLNVTQFNTLGTNGIPMQVIAKDARLLRDGAGNNMYYMTNSVTIGGGQSVDVLLHTAGLGGKTFFLYSKNLSQLANNAENFGGAMTEIVIN